MGGKRLKILDMKVKGKHTERSLEQQVRKDVAQNKEHGKKWMRR
jgi:hypothetical protein